MIRHTKTQSNFSPNESQDKMSPVISTPPSHMTSTKERCENGRLTFSRPGLASSDAGFGSVKTEGKMGQVGVTSLMAMVVVADVVVVV
mmetsp:Transcript_8813/g.17809  ORF Transcript_8813/g.17809 Transcript_8813/m.17809 type:complete len:88 (+) Transcript_8813:849-1112(+)